LVDCTQGIQAQTLANLYLAMEQDLAIIPVVNKIDLPAARPEETKKEIVNLLGCSEDEIIYASGKTGEGVEKLMDAIVERTPEPHKNPVFFSSADTKADETSLVNEPLKALIFDSNYDEYKGVVAYVRVVEGSAQKHDKIALMATGSQSEALDVGKFSPDYRPTKNLAAGDIGYIITGFKDVSECRVGDTITTAKAKDKINPLQGYKEPKPMVFAGIFPREGSELERLREAIDKLKLNDSSLIYEPEHSHALGFGFRCGFLGILHLEIFRERLKREYNLDLVVTVPSVAYKVYKSNGEEFTIRTPQQLPPREETQKIEEPWVTLDVITPKEYLGGIMNLAQEKRAVYKNTEFMDEDRAILHYEIPLNSILTDFYDKIKSVSSGFASLNYEFLGYREANVVKLDIYVAEEPVEALASIVYEDEAYRRGREITETLKETLPRQMFVLKIQAAVGGKVLASEKLSAMRKDVTAKLYGGDVSRKRKLLEKQKKGKKKMEASGKGKVDIPDEAFVKILKK